MVARTRGRFAAATGALALVALPRAVQADDTKVRCAAAYEQAQELRRQDKLSASRTQLAICEQSCPPTLAADCTRWRSEVDALTPTVRLRVTDGDGRAADARVFVDGALLLEHVGTAPVALDSGEHLLHFESAAGSGDARISVHGGERGREVAVVLRAPSGGHPAETSGASGPPVATLVLGGIGALGLGLGAALAVKGHLDAAHLRSTCAPACNPSDVDAARTLYTIGWVSAGVGVASLAAALLVWHPWTNGSSSAAMRGLYVTPALGGATLGITFL